MANTRYNRRRVLPVDVYVRVSRVGKRENLISPEEQELRARDLARERGLTVGLVLTDLDESGGRLDRPGLQEALSRVEDGRSGGIIVAWLDRLSRDSEHALGLVRRISEAGGAVYAPDAPSDWTTPEGELQAGIIFQFAQYVRKRSRAGFERAKERAIANGIPVTSRAPVGYRRGKDRHLEPDPRTAPIIAELFERRAAGTWPSELADFLKANGVRTSRGASDWSKRSILYVLHSRVYLGEISYGKDRRFVNSTAHEPIIDLATWTAAQYPNGRGLQAPRGTGRYSLSGILRCAGCGYAMQPTTHRGKRVYRCSRRNAGGICPQPAWIKAERIEAWAEGYFLEQMADITASRTLDERPILEPLERGLERADRRLQQALTPEVQDAAGSEWAGMVAERRRERDEAARALGEARAAQSKPALALVDIRRLGNDWPTLEPSERRELLAAHFDLLALHKDGHVSPFPRGTAPDFMSRRGFTREPRLRPIVPGEGEDYVTIPP